MPKYINHTSGQVTGDGTTTATARAYGNGLSVSAGDDVRALATLPVDTGLSAVWEHRSDKVIVNSQAFYQQVHWSELKRKTATWTRSGTTATITSSSHGLSSNDWIHLPPNGTSDLRPFPYLVSTGVYMHQITVTDLNTFTVTCTNSGNTSGWLEYTCKLCEPDRYFTWTRSGTTITATTYSAHGQSGSLNINIVMCSSITAIIQTSIKAATFSSTNTISWTDANAGATSGGGFYEHAWIASANVTSTALTTAGHRNCGVQQSLVTVTAFTTGIIGYVPLKAAMDLSAFQMISFIFSSSIVYTGVTLRLCSDAAGATPITGCDWQFMASTPTVQTRRMAITFTPYGSATIWTASQGVSADDLRYVPFHGTGHSGVYKCTTTGTCGTVEPIWNTDGSTITDGTATWVFNGYVNLPNNVLSISLYANNDLAAATYTLDSMMAFKAPTDATCLTYEHLILPPPEAAIARNTAYSLGDIKVPSPSYGSNLRYICTTAGTTHATTEPTWDTHDNSMTTDGDSVWKNLGYQDTPYQIKSFIPVDSVTHINLHDGGLVTGYQSSASLKYWSLGYFNPLFPTLLTQTASVGNSSITVIDSLGFIVGETICISDIDDYVITSNDTSTNVIGITPNIVTERAIGQVVRFKKKTANLWKIRPHYNMRWLSLTINTGLDGFNSQGTYANPITYTGGYDSTYTNIVGRTYIYGFNHSGQRGFSNITNRGYINLYNMCYFNFTIGIAIGTQTAGPLGRYGIIRNCQVGACSNYGFQLAPTNSNIIFLEHFSGSLFAGSADPAGMLTFGSGALRAKCIFLHGNRRQDTIYFLMLCYVSNQTGNLYLGGENFFDEVYLGNTTCAINDSMTGGTYLTTSTAAGCCGLDCGFLAVFARNLKSDFCNSGAVTGQHVQNRFLNIIDRYHSNPFYIPQLPMAGSATFASWLMAEGYQENLNTIRWEQWGAVVLNDTSITGFYWKCSITDTMFNTVVPCRLPVQIKISVTSGVSCSFKIKMRRDSTNITCGLRIDADYNNLDMSDITALITAGADTDEDVTLTFTPDRTGWIEPKIIGYSTDTTSSFYFGQITKISG